MSSPVINRALDQPVHRIVLCCDGKHVAIRHSRVKCCFAIDSMRTAYERQARQSWEDLVPEREGGHGHRMEMHQIRYFLAVADALNFTRAAEQCNVSQPALTRAIQQLEEELGDYYCGASAS
jgi:hypothetical protein